MSCYSCAASFGLFKKEMGCKNCGYSFCKDCLSKKAEIPKHGHEKHRVCLKCHKLLTSQAVPNIKPQQYSPPAAYKKRMAQLQDSSTKLPEKKILNANPQGNTSAHGSENHQNKLSKKFKNMSKEDIAIAQRLDRLKESKDSKPAPTTKEIEQRLENIRKDAAPPPSEQELVARLAKLKGQDPAKIAKPHVFPTDRRTDTEKVNDLLDEVFDEVEIDSHTISHAEDVQNRLDVVKGQPDYDKPGDLQNNLDTPNSKDQHKYVKNIPHVDSNFESASGESVDWTDMNRLINQVASELEIDANKAIAGLQKDTELWDRLNKLKKKRSVSTDESEKDFKESKLSHSKSEELEDEENEEEACKTLIKQLLEESRLEDQLAQEEVECGRLKHVPNISSTSQLPQPQMVGGRRDSEPEELPWCCMCNKDASLRCLGCDGDLYCKRCYKEGHDREDYEDHPVKPYKPPAKK